MYLCSCIYCLAHVVSWKYHESSHYLRRVSVALSTEGVSTHRPLPPDSWSAARANTPAHLDQSSPGRDDARLSNENARCPRRATRRKLSSCTRLAGSRQELDLIGRRRNGISQLGNISVACAVRFSRNPRRGSENARGRAKVASRVEFCSPEHYVYNMRLYDYKVNYTHDIIIRYGITCKSVISVSQFSSASRIHNEIFRSRYQSFGLNIFIFPRSF